MSNTPGKDLQVQTKPSEDVSDDCSEGYSDGSYYSSQDSRGSRGSHCSYTVIHEKDKQIGKYRIEEQLSCGGFSTTFRAHVQSWTRGKGGKKGRRNRKRARQPSKEHEPVCLKIHHADDDPSEVFEMAKREFNLCSRLEQCTNIVNVMECQQFTHPSTRELFTYCAMQLMPMDLQQYEESQKHTGGIDDPEIWEITRQISNGLSAMHRIGYVHTDLKLENILLKPADDQSVIQAVICDLGSCHKIGDALENNGHTLEYSAPELIAEIDSLILPCTDVYALGCIIYYLMCGADMFDRDLVGDSYIEVLAAQERYSRTSTHTQCVKNNVDYFNRRGILLDNATISAQQIPLWWEVHKNNLTQKTINIICGCTEADPEQRLTLEALRTLLDLLKLSPNTE